MTFAWVVKISPSFLFLFLHFLLYAKCIPVIHDDKESGLVVDGGFWLKARKRFYEDKQLPVTPERV